MHTISIYEIFYQTYQLQLKSTGVIRSHANKKHLLNTFVLSVKT